MSGVGREEVLISNMEGKRGASSDTKIFFPYEARDVGRAEVVVWRTKVANIGPPELN